MVLKAVFNNIYALFVFVYVGVCLFVCVCVCVCGHKKLGERGDHCFSVLVG